MPDIQYRTVYDPPQESLAEWEGERRPAPQKGVVRISMLTPSGIHFGEGGFNVLAADPLGGPVLSAATDLLNKLVSKVRDQQRDVTT